MFKGILVVMIDGGALYLPSGHPSLGNEELTAHLLKGNIALKPYEPELPDKVLCVLSELNYQIHSKIK
jgi:hypothetical protein